MHVPRKFVLLAVATVALLAAIVFGPSLYIGLFKYIPALAVNRAAAAFVVKHDHLSAAVIILGSLMWNALLGWKLCHRSEPVPAKERSRFQRWRYRHYLSVRIHLVCALHPLLRWTEKFATWLNAKPRGVKLAFKFLRASLLVILGAFSLIMPAGVFAGSALVRYLEVRAWIKVSTISVLYTISCWFTQSSAGQLMRHPHPYQQYVPYVIYAVAVILIGKPLYRRWAPQIKVQLVPYLRPAMPRFML